MGAYRGLMQYIRGRRSVREFREQPVPRDLIERVIEAASWAPSAANRQDWFFSVAESPGLRRDMVEAVRRKWQAIVEDNRDLGIIEEVEGYAAGFAAFERAPVVIAVSAAKVSGVQRRLIGEAAGATVGSLASAAMAAQNLMLAAHALGLATCCMTGAVAAHEELGRLLELGRRREFVCLIALGYPATAPHEPTRKPVAAIARFHQ